jgi:hypothetical protein
MNSGRTAYGRCEEGEWERRNGIVDLSAKMRASHVAGFSCSACILQEQWYERRSKSDVEARTKAPDRPLPVSTG